MGYNTRRKSLSLPSLGIQLPHSSRAAHRSPPATATPTTATTPPSEDQTDMPPAKKVKRSHPPGSPSPSPSSPGRTAAAAASDNTPAPLARMAENTPPPSPGAHRTQKVDTRGIDDEIVVAVIEQLERTGNKPHLLKELAAVLSTQLAIVQGSANQSAIISSRLTSYLRRPWSALSPCPVGKELIGTHPKRIYFFLTTCDHQEFPDPEEVNAQNAQARAAARIITPSLSSNGGSAAGSNSGEEAQDEKDRRARQQLSPSPELDLSMHETDLVHDGNTGYDIDMDLEPDVASLTRTFSGRNSLSREQSHRPNDTRRAVSPPLEGDEREFTRTASELQALAQRKRIEEDMERERRASRELSQASGSVSAASTAGAPATPVSAGTSEAEVDIKMELHTPEAEPEEDRVAIADESEEACALRNSECAKELFGDNGVSMLSIASPLVRTVHFNVSSPMVKPTTSVLTGKAAAPIAGWSELDLQSPENVDLEELDILFDSY